MNENRKVTIDEAISACETIIKAMPIITIETIKDNIIVVMKYLKRAYETSNIEELLSNKEESK